MEERYRIIKPKGSGAYSDVYKAHDTVDGRIVAKKELRVPNEWHRMRFKREAKMLRKYASSPYFVDIYDEDLDAPAPYIILAYSSLGSLHPLIGKVSDWQVAAMWLSDMAHGLEAMQQQGDMHRDIKPGNLLRFSTPGGVIVQFTDFGLAHKADNTSGPMTNSVFGTEGYIDPVARKMGCFFPQSDTYSCGRVIRAIMTGDPGGALPITVPVGFRNLVNSMTSLNLLERPTPQYIYQTVEGLLYVPTLRALPDLPTLPLGNIGWKGGLFLGGLAFLVLLGSANTWDDNVGRYRNGNGEFASGLFG